MYADMRHNHDGTKVVLFVGGCGRTYRKCAAEGSRSNTAGAKSDEGRGWGRHFSAASLGIEAGRSNHGIRVSAIVQDERSADMHARTCHRMKESTSGIIERRFVLLLPHDLPKPKTPQNISTDLIQLQERYFAKKSIVGWILTETYYPTSRNDQIPGPQKKVQRLCRITFLPRFFFLLFRCTPNKVRACSVLCYYLKLNIKYTWNTYNYSNVIIIIDRVTSARRRLELGAEFAERRVIGLKHCICNRLFSPIKLSLKSHEYANVMFRIMDVRTSTP